VKFQQSKDNNNLNNWKKRGSPTKLNSQSPTKFNSQSPHSILKQHEIHHKNSDASQRMLNHPHVPHSLRQRLLPHPTNADILIPTIIQRLLGLPSSSIFAMMGSLLIPTVLRHLLGLNLKQVLERKTMNFRFKITTFRLTMNNCQIHPERKYLVAVTLNPSAQPPLWSIFAMMGSILIPTVLWHLLGLNLRSRSKTKTKTLDYILKVIPSQL
jgi:hypothetical protein